MGDHTFTVSFLLFLASQLTQGLVLNYFLVRERSDDNLWLWIIADGIVLLAWVALLLHRRKAHLSVDMPLVQLPTIAAAWLAYLCVVLVPRLAWLMTDARYCLGLREAHFTEVTYLNGILNQVSWGPNTLVTTLAVGSTTMLMCLVLAGYGEHGLLSSRSPLDFDMAEAAFCLIDGVEFLQGFFDVDGIASCSVSNSTGPSNDSVVTMSTEAQNSQLEQYLAALDGTLGNIIITLAITSFCLPFLALWLFKLCSNVLKATAKIRDERVRLAGIPRPSVACVPDTGYSGQQNTVPVTDGNLASSSEFRLDISALESTVDRFEKSITIIKFIYIFWDIFLINLPGAVVRFLLWSQFGRPISALITKNILSVLFRMLNIFNDYIRPACTSRDVSLVSPSEQQVVLPNTGAASSPSPPPHPLLSVDVVESATSLDV